MGTRYTPDDEQLLPIFDEQSRRRDNRAIMRESIAKLGGSPDASAWMFLVSLAREAGHITEDEERRVLDGHSLRRSRRKGHPVEGVVRSPELLKQGGLIYGKLSRELQRAGGIEADEDLRVVVAKPRRTPRQIAEALERAASAKREDSLAREYYAVARRTPEMRPVSIEGALSIPWILAQAPLFPLSSRPPRGVHEVQHGKAFVLSQVPRIHPITKRPVFVPGGLLPRRLLNVIHTEYVKSRNREIDLGNNPSEMLARLHMAPSGQNARNLQLVLESLSTMTVAMGWREPDGTAGKFYQGHLFERIEGWPAEVDGQECLWVGGATLGRLHAELLEARGGYLPITADAMELSSALAHDVLAWLSAVLPTLDNPWKIKWKDLPAHLVGGHMSAKELKRRLLGRPGQPDVLAIVLAAYPAARIEADDSGLILRRSLPRIQPRRRVVQRKQDGRSMPQLKKSAKRP